MGSGVAGYEVKNNGTKLYFKDFNKAAEQLEKIKKKNVLGKEVRDVFPGAKDMGFVDLLKKVYKTGEVVFSPAAQYVDPKTGKTYFRENYIYRLSNGDVVAIFSNVTDRITAEKALKEKLEELEQINKLMVGRELKMIELKKEIKKLKGDVT